MLNAALFTTKILEGIRVVRDRGECHLGQMGAIFQCVRLPDAQGQRTLCAFGYRMHKGA